MSDLISWMPVSLVIEPKLKLLSIPLATNFLLITQYWLVQGTDYISIIVCSTIKLKSIRLNQYDVMYIITKTDKSFLRDTLVFQVSRKLVTFVLVYFSVY